MVLVDFVTKMADLIGLGTNATEKDNADTFLKKV